MRRPLWENAGLMPNLMVAKCLISNASGTQKAQLPAQMLSLPTWGRETDVPALNPTSAESGTRSDVSVSATPGVWNQPRSACRVVLQYAPGHINDALEARP